MEYLDLLTSSLLISCLCVTALILGEQLILEYVFKRSPETKSEDVVEEHTRKFEQSFAVGLRRVNLRYNRYYVSRKYPHLTNAMVHLHYFLITRDYSDVRYTPRQLFVKLQADLQSYNYSLLNRYGRDKETTALVNGLNRIIGEVEDYTGRAGDGFDKHRACASVNLRELLNNIDDDLLCIENKEILSPYYHYEVSQDNSINRIYSYLKNYELC